MNNTNEKTTDAQKNKSAMTALERAMEACDMMMRRFTADQLPPVGHFHYHQGVFLSGVMNVYEASKKNVYLNFVKDWVDSVVLEDGSIPSLDEGQLDDLQPGILLFPLYKKTKSLAYETALHRIAGVLKEFPKCQNGGYWHKQWHPHQMWLDGLYMAGPFSAEYSMIFQDNTLLEEAADQVILMQDKTKDPVTGLWYHAYDESKNESWADKETGLAPEFWGRSIGWVPVAILDELRFLPKDHPKHKVLVTILTDLLKAVVQYQDNKTGLWYQVINKGNDSRNWLESSCTCLFVAALCRSVKEGYLSSSYLSYAKKGYEGIMNRLKYDENGVVIDNICVGTGVGDYAHYCGRPTSFNDLHGVGAYLLMCTAVHQSMEEDQV